MQVLTNNTLSDFGHRLYHCDRIREYVYYLRFRVRCLCNRAHLETLDRFFAATNTRRELVRWVPEFIEQATRHFFHQGTDWEDRIRIIQEHVEVLEGLFDSNAIETIYAHRESIVLWKGSFQDQPLICQFGFDSGEKKEGILALRLDLGNTRLYRIIFWLAKGSDGAPIVCVGAMQGTSNEHATTLIHNLTKAFFGYRTKNLILFCLRNFAQALGIETIHAVTNAGHYTMDRMKREQTLKTDLDSFWAECGGSPMQGDPRFFIISSVEPRKNEAEVKPNKRSQYRHRFEKLDAMASDIQANVARLVRKSV